MKRLASIVALTLMASTILPSQCVFAQNDKISVFVNGNELLHKTGDGSLSCLLKWYCFFNVFLLKNCYNKII